MKLITLLLWMLLAGSALADTLPVSLTLPEDACEGMARATADDAAQAAALLGTDAEALRAELDANGVSCLLVSPAGALWQVNLEESSVSGLDFDRMGQKKAAIFAQQLAQTSGQETTVVKLSSAQDAPQTVPEQHRSGLWIRLSPGGADYPRTDTWLTAIRGRQVTVTVTWPSQEEETARSEQLTRLLCGLALAEAAE